MKKKKTLLNFNQKLYFPILYSASVRHSVVSEDGPIRHENYTELQTVSSGELNNLGHGNKIF